MNLAHLKITKIYKLLLNKFDFKSQVEIGTAQKNKWHYKILNGCVFQVVLKCISFSLITLHLHLLLRSEPSEAESPAAVFV